MRKYDLIAQEDGRYRVRAARSFGDVRKGDIGGFVDGEHNLSHFGASWVYDDSAIGGKATVGMHAKVQNGGIVMGDADVGGKAVVDGGIVSDNARVLNDAVVKGRVADSATVSGNAEIGKGASVIGHAFCSENFKLQGNATIQDYAKGLGIAIVRDNAVVRDYATVTDGAVIDGNAVVKGRASVLNYASVSENAVVKDNAVIANMAMIMGRAEIKGYAKIKDSAIVQGSTVVRGHANISGNAMYLKDDIIENFNYEPIDKFGYIENDNGTGITLPEHDNAVLSIERDIKNEKLDVVVKKDIDSEVHLRYSIEGIKDVRGIPNEYEGELYLPITMGGEYEGKKANLRIISDESGITIDTIEPITTKVIVCNGKIEHDRLVGKDQKQDQTNEQDHSLQADQEVFPDMG